MAFPYAIPLGAEYHVLAGRPKLLCNACFRLQGLKMCHVRGSIPATSVHGLPRRRRRERATVSRSNEKRSRPPCIIEPFFWGAEPPNVDEHIAGCRNDAEPVPRATVGPVAVRASYRSILLPCARPVIDLLGAPFGQWQGRFRGLT
jgi:hypothetical protein